MYSVYLSGPIAGLQYGDAVNWRHEVQAHLIGVKCLSPMRAKEFLDNGEHIGVTKYDHIIASDGFIMQRDFWDTVRCDLMLVNLLDAKRVSIGTVMEIGWRYQAQKPMVAIIDPLHDHPMVRAACPVIVPTLAEAITVSRAILGA